MLFAVFRPCTALEGPAIAGMPTVVVRQHYAVVYCHIVAILFVASCPALASIQHYNTQKFTFVQRQSSESLWWDAVSSPSIQLRENLTRLLTYLTYALFHCPSGTSSSFLTNTNSIRIVLIKIGVLCPQTTCLHPALCPFLSPDHFFRCSSAVSLSLFMNLARNFCYPITTRKSLVILCCARYVN